MKFVWTIKNKLLEKNGKKTKVFAENSDLTTELKEIITSKKIIDITGKEQFKQALIDLRRLAEKNLKLLMTSIYYMWSSFIILIL